MIKRARKWSPRGHNLELDLHIPKEMSGCDLALYFPSAEMRPEWSWARFLLARPEVWVAGLLLRLSVAGYQTRRLGLALVLVLFVAGFVLLLNLLSTRLQSWSWTSCPSIEGARGDGTRIILKPTFRLI